jgi:hypothetical protein
MNKSVIVTMVLLSAAFSAQAQVSNGDFSAGTGGWSASSTDNVSTYHDATGGNPGGTAVIFGDGGFFTEPEGQGTYTQTFDCGEAGSGSNCTITFQYRSVLDSGVLVNIDAFIDGVAQFSVPVTGGNSGWNDVSISVPCGTHQLTLRALYFDGGFEDEWRIFFDNVEAECDSAVGNEDMSWGALKASLY